MSSAEPPRAGRGLLQRLDLLYFVLAAFDLITICTALFLNHLTITAFEAGVRTSAEWSQRQAEIIHLQRLAHIADAPGNDLFISRNVVAERARFVPALAAFNAERAHMSAEIAAATLSARDAEIAARLESIQLTMDQMTAETEIIFREFERGREERASRGMAVMDRTFAILVQRMDETLAVVEAGRAEHLQTQLERAQSLRVLEFVIGGAVLLIVGFVAAYGAYMGRTLRANAAQRAAMLSEVAAARDRLQHYANDVSHELRGPISKMRLDAEVLLRHERTDDQYRDGIESILVETQRLTTIVESLLFLARAENTKVSLRPTPLNAQKELALIVEFFAAAAEKDRIDLSVRPAKGVIWADRTLFQRAVSNLVSNALAHVMPGGRVALSVAADASGAIVEVADTGTGIAPDLLARVFDRFQRGDASGSGLGLGLAITKSIMELHGGSIELTSPPGAGVTARLRFPKRTAPPVAAPTTSDRAHA